MVQILPRPESKAESFSRLITGGLSGLAQGGDFIKQALNERSTRKGLEEEFGDIFGKVRDPETRRQLLGGEIEKRNQAAKLRGEYEADEESYNKIKDAFGQKFADVWKASPTGARTALTQAALEARARGIDLDQMLGFMEKDTQPADQGISSEMMSPEQQVDEELQNLKTEQDEGLLPEERIARGKERYTTGLKDYQEAGTKLRAFTRDKERLDILKDLEKGGKLPKGLGRINVDKDGNLRLPFLASADAQRFVKTLNEFSAGAKDTFGARVTNFDLIQFLRRFPTLLNTAEGRDQLYDQMSIVNQINSVYYKNLKKVYDDAGGVRRIDSDVAERLAEKLSEPQVNRLSKKFSEVGQFSSKPNASEFKGRKIQDEETGEIFISNGNDWVPAE